jgi:hypothetical protein
LIGAFLGVYVTPIAHPAEGISIWIGLFALAGVIAANVVAIIVTEIAKSFMEPNETPKTPTAPS